METTAPKTDDNDQNQLKKWLMARTVGSPTAWNRLLNFHLVRSTKAVVYTPHLFVQDAGSGFASLRTAENLVQQPDYPDPTGLCNKNAHLVQRPVQQRSPPLPAHQRWRHLGARGCATMSVFLRRPHSPLSKTARSELTQPRRSLNFLADGAGKNRKFAKIRNL